MVLFLLKDSTLLLEIYLNDVFLRKGMVNGKWIDVLPTLAKQYINRIHSSTKLTSIQANLKKNAGFVYKILLDKRKKIKPKFQRNDLVRSADLKKTFSKGDTTN